MLSKVPRFFTEIASVPGLLKTLEEERQHVAREREQWQQERSHLLQRLEELEVENTKLRGQLTLNSQNSSKPPSTDLCRSSKSLRQRSGRPVGGQKGHEGHHLAFSDTPQRVEVHSPARCENCGEDLSPVSGSPTLKRQVFDLPPLQLEVSEHQVERKICPCCHQVNEAAFPVGVEAPTQYGPRLKGLAVYLNQYQLLPLDRCQQLFEDLWRQPLSPATIDQSVHQVATSLESSQQQVAQALIQSEVVHFDETSLFENKHRRWLHSASTGQLTFYFIHDKRGREGMDAAGILPLFQNIALHDHWESYQSYGCTHGFCNAHHLRELTRAHDQEQKDWAQDMITLLLDLKEQVAQAKTQGLPQLSSAQKADGVQKYRDITQKALSGYPPLPPSHKRGRPKQPFSKNLLDRLIRYETETLLFMEDFRVPFDNNQAERDIRMVKLKQKISGGFRSQAGSSAFCTIRGALSTARKQGQSILQVLTQALLPTITPSLS